MCGPACHSQQYILEKNSLGKKKLCQTQFRSKYLKIAITSFIHLTQTLDPEKQSIAHRQSSIGSFLDWKIATHLLMYAYSKSYKFTLWGFMKNVLLNRS